jgi:hypothetical protein
MTTDRWGEPLTHFVGEFFVVNSCIGTPHLLDCEASLTEARKSFVQITRSRLEELRHPESDQLV